jgi:hypothetical protein
MSFVCDFLSQVLTDPEPTAATTPHLAPGEFRPTRQQGVVTESDIKQFRLALRPCLLPAPKPLLKMHDLPSTGNPSNGKSRATGDRSSLLYVSNVPAAVLHWVEQGMKSSRTLHQAIET